MIYMHIGQLGECSKPGSQNLLDSDGGTELSEWSNFQYFQVELEFWTLKAYRGLRDPEC